MPGGTPGIPQGSNPQVVSPGGQSIRAGIVAQAAKAWGIPANLLWGVYGTETNFGKDVNTSSAQAKGSFQFIPGTAAQYNYPYTNATDLKTFTQQAYGAAHYLHDLYAQTGNWNSALASYSGNTPGYASKVDANGQGFNGVKISNSLGWAIATLAGLAIPITAGASSAAIIAEADSAVATDAGGAGAGATAAGAGAGGGTAATLASKLGGGLLSNLGKETAIAGLIAALLDKRILFVVGGFVIIVIGLSALVKRGLNAPSPS